jgi:hypothetical protein
VLSGSVCVPTDTCGPGTKKVGNECVPDGTMICEQGTVFDPQSGRCEVDPSACAMGTVLVNGTCVPEDSTLPNKADLKEAAEPNGPGSTTAAGILAVPAVDAATTLYGCVNPVDADGDGLADVDQDAWIINNTTGGPVVLEITADGIGGLAAGFGVVSADPNHPAALDSWQRLGLNLTGDTSKRQVYLPVGGAYALLLTDSRALFLDQPAGSPTACYFATVKRVATPASTALTLPQTAGQDSGKVAIYSYTADALGDVFDMTHNTNSQAMVPAFLIFRGNQLVAAAAGDSQGNPPYWTIGGLNPSETLTVVVDMQYNTALAPQPYTLDSFDIGAQPLPTDGSTLTVTRKNGQHPNAPYVDLNYLFFDVGDGGAVLHFNLTASTPLDMLITRRDIFTPTGAIDRIAIVDPPGDSGRAAFQNEYVRFLAPGRYYFLVTDPAPGAAAGTTFTVTSTLTKIMPSAITFGTPLVDQSLPTPGVGFHSLDLTNPIWVELKATGADWGGAVRLSAYDLAGEGWLAAGSGNVNPLFVANQPATGEAPIGRILVGDTRDYLLRVEQTGASGGSPKYSLAVGSREFVDLGTIATGAPINRTGMDDLAAGASRRYFIKGDAGHSLSFAATPSSPTADLRIDVRKIDETIAAGGTTDAGGAGVAETASLGFGAAPGNYLALTITETAGQATGVNLTLTATAPKNYAITTGTLAFDDACVGGTVVFSNGDDELSSPIDLPAGFNFALYGQPVSQYVIGANGLVTFGPAKPTCQFGCFANGAIPSTAQPNGVVAPFWDDLQETEVCRKDGADRVTVQWVGHRYNAPSDTVAFQVVFHQTGVIDFIYGANQAATGATATVGLENLAGLFGQQVLKDMAGIMPSTSRTFTPAP